MNRWIMVAIGVTALGAEAGSVAAQVRLENLSVTMAVGTELYGGNFSAITVPQIDSTERALAGAGEMGTRGTLTLLARDDRSLRVEFDGGMRQFVTTGFQLRNYAPRELSGLVRGSYRQRLRGGTLVVTPTIDTRLIADRPPMPLYLPPGYSSGSLDANYSKGVATGLTVFGRMAGEIKDYAAPRVLQVLDLLDRRTLTAQAGVSKLFFGAADTRDQTVLTFFGAYHHHSYPKQGLGLLRTDNGLQTGGELRLDRRESNGFQVSLSANATRNRSNSRRVDYNAARVRAEATVELGDDTQLNLRGLWNVKRYIHPQEALVPGEEADNATIVNAEITRFLGEGVRAGIGGGWTRAETNFSGDYYQRLSVSFSLTVNPRF